MIASRHVAVQFVKLSIILLFTTPRRKGPTARSQHRAVTTLKQPQMFKSPEPLLGNRLRLFWPRPNWRWSGQMAIAREHERCLINVPSHHLSPTRSRNFSVFRETTPVFPWRLSAKEVGIGRFSTHFTIQSLTDLSFELETEALILLRLTSKLLARRALDLDLSIFDSLKLTDPQFSTPNSIDVILRADLYIQLLRPGLRQFKSPSLIAQNTALGWVVSGSTRSWWVESHPQSSVRLMHCASDIELSESLQRFWNIEEFLSPKNLLSPNELKSEMLFSDTHIRESNGRFVRASLLNTHRRFARDPKLGQDFQEFMSKYESLGHMDVYLLGKLIILMLGISLFTRLFKRTVHPESDVSFSMPRAWRLCRWYFFPAIKIQRSQL